MKHTEQDEADAEKARILKGYKDSENFHDPYLNGAIVERKKSDAFRDGFTTGRQSLRQEVDRLIEEAVVKERTKIMGELELYCSFLRGVNKFEISAKKGGGDE